MDFTDKIQDPPKSSRIIKEIAHYKRCPGLIPYRPGPLQCIGVCPHCLPTKIKDSEDKIKMKSFDNLARRRGLWLSKYQCIMMHMGQVDIVKQALQLLPLSVYIVALDSISDIYYLKLALKHTQIPIPQLLDNNLSVDDLTELLTQNKSLILPVQLKSCVSDRTSNNQTVSKCYDGETLEVLLRGCDAKVFENSGLNFHIIPVVMTKDHDRFKLFGFGAISLQILEPYTLKEFDYQNKFGSKKAAHLVRHLYHDLSKNAVIFPSHLVAFLLLYLDRYEGISQQDLVSYLKWFKKVSTWTEMHIGFTGNLVDAVEAAIIVLAEFIKSDKNNFYIPRDYESLLEYAKLVTPMLVYNGIIAKAILDEYNRADRNEDELYKLPSGMEIKVRKDEVLKTCEEYACRVEHIIPIRRPCRTNEASLSYHFDQMKYDHYFEVEEPITTNQRKCDWLDDSDEDYDNPRFQAWILLTNRDYRRDRLNLLINAVESYLA